MENNSFGNINYHKNQPSDNPDMTSDLDRWSMDKQTAERFGQDTKHRKWLVIWMMIVVSIWLVTVLIIIMFNIPLSLKIDDKVLITLLATTTVNVLGLSKIILGGLFDHPKRNKR